MIESELLSIRILLIKIGPRKILIIDSVLKTGPWINKINDLNNKNNNNNNNNSNNNNNNSNNNNNNNNKTWVK